MANNVFHQFPGQLFPQGHQLPGHNNAGGGLGIEAFSRFKDITKYQRKSNIIIIIIIAIITIIIIIITDAVEALTMMFNSNTSSGFFFIDRAIIERLQSMFARLDRNKSGELGIITSSLLLLLSSSSSSSLLLSSSLSSLSSLSSSSSSDSNDFSDSIPHIDQSLRGLWSQIRDRMDVNNDGNNN